ncbi:hypothetical protein PLESTB_000568700 [Pleodorina starrii]|uniref:Actin-binding transcription modulator n=1 Tax=Pleodorina starrii TaxID=330485 RepID=A0A9W6F0M0_9CHLO|nr:hypothetical protein PLESTM_000315900 [Pleodorina starrii]GLC51972.1 hypothetical protein PLESTB_000568700 [Pleodorina starrii]GLC68549.1 hypothetical protein PLESTF_000704500 [Pleodorina starrii]
MASPQTLAPNDWFEHPELLPPRPLGLTEIKFTRRFAVDLHGARCHDQYVYMAPNGLAVIGLAPSHPLVAAHRQATGYQPTQLRYVPPQVGHLKAEDLVAAVPEEEGQEDGAEAGAAQPRNGSGTAATATAGEAAAAAVPDEQADGEGAAAQPGGEAGGGGGASGSGGGGGGAAGGASGGAAASVSGRPEKPPVPECEPFPPGQCSRVNFEAGAARNLAGTKISGKKRGRGAQQLRGTTVLAQVERRGGGASFPIWTVLKGQLLEVNERLVKDPGLLYDRPCREGYVAILSPAPEAVQFFESRLMSEGEYLRLRGLSAEDLL